MTVVVDDAQLMRLALEPAHDVAWVLHRPAAFRPVVLLCCLLPPLWFAAWSRLDPETARWALRSLAVQQAERLEEWLEPGSQWTDCELRLASPLMSWLTAAALPLFPPGTAIAAVIVSAISLIGAGALLWQWCREAVGERTAFWVILLFALHPVLAPLASNGAPTALMLFLIIATGWGFWGHLVQNHGSVSFRLLAGGLAWGLALLAGGGLAIVFFAVLMLASLVSRTSTAEAGPSSGQRSAISAVFLLGITGAAISLWWPVMMWQSQGVVFLRDWLGIAPTEAHLSVYSRGGERASAWITEPGLLLGWWCLGCWSALRTSFAPANGSAQRWNRWLLIWNAVGLVGRIAWRGLDGTAEALHTWDVFVSLPATILAAQGLDRALRRETTRFGLALAIAITFGSVGWKLTHQLAPALLMGFAMLGILLLSAPLAMGLRRARSTWTEGEIRAWVVIAAVATVVGHSATTIIPLARSERDHTQWERVRQSMAAIIAVDQTSIVANDERALTSWIYLVRSLWPKAKFSHSIGWDPNVEATMKEEARHPQSRILLVDWSRNGLRFQSDVSTGWQVLPVVEPTAFRGHRLAVHVIQPLPAIPPL